MAVSREEVLAVARLARLRLTEPEVERLAAELSSILRHMESLAELESERAELGADDASLGMGLVAGWDAPLRDETAGPDPLDRPLAELAPAWEHGFFTVPRLAALDTAGPDDAAGGGTGPEGAEP